MQYVATSGEWWCPHCHNRAAASPAQPATAPATAPPAVSKIATPAAGAAPAPRPPTPAPVPVRAPTEGSRPTRLPVAPRSVVPAIMAMVLALIAVGMVGAALVRCGGDGGVAGPDRAMLVRVLPPDASHMRGVNWADLRGTDFGRGIMAELDNGLFDEMVEKACGARITDLLAWMVRSDQPGEIFGGLTVSRLHWTETEVNDCATKAASGEGEGLEITAQGLLRGYTFRDEPFWVAWLDDRTAVVSGEWKSDKQRHSLDAMLERRAKDPEPNRQLERALARVDTGASFWLVLARPDRQPVPLADRGWDEDEGGRTDVQRWYDDQIGDLLGARPDAIYLSLDVGSRLRIRGGAFYGTEHKANRAAERLETQLDRLGDAGGPGSPRLDRLDPVLRGDLERRLRAGAGQVHSFPEALAEKATVEARGEVVTFSADLDPAALGGPPAAGSVVAGINRLLPRSLKLSL